MAASPSSLPINLFTPSPSPPPPSFNHHSPPILPLPPIPRRRRRPKPMNEPSSPNPEPLQPQPRFTLPRRSPHYRKPIPGAEHSPSILPVDNPASGRAVVVGPSGVGFRLPGAPFDFQYSYSETPQAAPIAIREPAVLPFAPPTMPRPWTGKAPLLSKKEKAAKKGLRLFRPLGQEGDPVQGEDGSIVLETRGRKPLKQHLNMRFTTPSEEEMKIRSREEVLGKPLSRAEIAKLVRPHLSHNRQLNIGRDGVTHNMLEMVHCHWRREEVCKVRCRGVPTVDMDNICQCIEEKTGGKVIHQKGGVIFLYRGRNYDFRSRPRYPVMLWKPAAPVYPKLIQAAPEGLTKEEADEMRLIGRNLLPICKLSKNGIYINLVKDVRDAFEGSELVKINCAGMHTSDYRKLGAKLKELVPCVLLSFDDEQILMWRGKEWRSNYPTRASDHEGLPPATTSSGNSSSASGQSVVSIRRSSPKMLTLWKRALHSSKAILLDADETPGIGPDLLLKRVEDFAAASQTAVHSYPAVLVASSANADPVNESDGEPVISKQEADYGHSDDFDHFVDARIGSLAIDSIIQRLDQRE